MPQIGVAIIGTGAIALANHLPGLALTPQAKIVALCDRGPATLERAASRVPQARCTADWASVVSDDAVDAIIIATPNHLHAPIALAAIAQKKHLLCEKPLALNFDDAQLMARAAEAAGVRHMTAFTYRFVPAMRYMKHVVDSGGIGVPFHFRAQRFQDWGQRPLGWRQTKSLAGSGEMGDMLSHRIDYAHHLIGPIKSLVADLRNFVPTRGGQPSDVDDWVAILCQFCHSNATGVLESTKLAAGRSEGHRGQDLVEVNGSEGTIVYSTQKPLELWIGKRGNDDLENIAIPASFHLWPGSPRDPAAGDLLATFRYDQDFEFIDAIANHRRCQPSFDEGARVQAVMDAAMKSSQERRWVDVESA